MKRTMWGLSAMALSLVFGAVVALGSLTAMRGKLDTDMLTRQPFSIPTILVSCLDPLAILLEIAAIVLIVLDSRQFGVLQHRLAWAAAILYLVWAAANLLGFLPLSLLSAQNGSRSLALTGQWIKAISALLAFAVPALLAFGLSRKVMRVGLVLGWLLSAIGGFGSVAMAISHLRLEAIRAAGQTLYVAKFNVDYTTGVYPALLVASHVGGLLYLMVYAYLARKMWLRVRAGSGAQASTA
jgi:hypothetical protein